jgi:hypothetical protein
MTSVVLYNFKWNIYGYWFQILSTSPQKLRKRDRVHIKVSTLITAIRQLTALNDCSLLFLLCNLRLFELFPKTVTAIYKKPVRHHRIGLCQ